MLVDSCQAPGRICQHLNFCFPCKTEPFLLGFSQQLQKRAKNSNVLDTVLERDISRAHFFKILMTLVEDHAYWTLQMKYCNVKTGILFLFACQNPHCVYTEICKHQFYEKKISQKTLI